MKYLIWICLIFTQIQLSAQLLIKNVNVLDVESKKVLSGYDVVVIGDRIVSIHKDKMYKLPPGTEVIDGTNKWLSPGFVDAHVHFFKVADCMHGQMRSISENINLTIRS